MNTLWLMLGLLAVTVVCLMWGITSAEKQESRGKKR